MSKELGTRAVVRDFLHRFPGLDDKTLAELLGTHDQRAVQNLRIPPMDTSLALGSSNEFSPDSESLPATQILLLAERSSGGTGTGYLDMQRALIRQVTGSQSGVGIASRVEVTFATKYRHSETIGLSIAHAQDRWGSLSHAWQADNLHPGFFGLVVRYVGDEEKSAGQRVQQLRLDRISWIEHPDNDEFQNDMDKYRSELLESRKLREQISLKVINTVPRWHELSSYLHPSEAGLQCTHVDLSTPNSSLSFGEYSTQFTRLHISEAPDREGTRMAHIEFQPTQPPEGLLRLDPSPLAFTIPIRTRST